MNRARLTCVFVSIVLTGMAHLAFAQTAAAQATPQTDSSPNVGHVGRWEGGQPRQGHPAVRAAIHNLREIRRLYLITGHANQLPALYQDVLAKTQNPLLRNYVYQELARAELRPSDPDKAIATLRASLDENLTQLAGQTSGR
jgi:hypothetical protein